MISLGCDINKFVFRKGWFSQTFNQPLPESVALLHCDADWFESVLLTVRTFYDLIPDGGIVVLDDFGWWEGARRAFYVFCRETGEEPLLNRIGRIQAFWIKGKRHNRIP